MKKLNEVQVVKQETKKRGCAESKGICKMCKVCRENNKKRIDSQNIMNYYLINKIHTRNQPSLYSILLSCVTNIFIQTVYYYCTLRD